MDKICSIFNYVHIAADGTIWFGTRGKWAFCARGAESAWQAVLSRVAAGQSWKKMRPGSVNVAASDFSTTLRKTIETRLGQSRRFD